MRTHIKNVRLALPALLAVDAVGAGGTGCGGYSAAAGPGASQPSVSSGQRCAPASSRTTETAGIAQRNGGDMDTVNHGGPSDGDGNQ